MLTYKCNRLGCSGEVRPFLADDRPGIEIRRYRCGLCKVEVGPEWEERNWGQGEVPPILEGFYPWEGPPKVNEITAWQDRLDTTFEEAEDD